MVTLWCRFNVATSVVSGAALRKTSEKPQNGTGAPHGLGIADARHAFNFQQYGPQ